MSRWIYLQIHSLLRDRSVLGSYEELIASNLVAMRAGLLVSASCRLAVGGEG